MVWLHFLPALHMLCLVCWLIVGSVQAFTQWSWAEAYSLANETVQQLTLDEKLGLVIGVGKFGSHCSIMLSLMTLTIPPICFNDGPAGLWLVKEVTGFPTGINTANEKSQSWTRMGEVIYPAVTLQMLAGPDPYLSGEFAYETIVGIQSMGVQACTKHFIANNQEHSRYGLSADVDDRRLHEIYWWPFMRSIDIRASVYYFTCAYRLKWAVKTRWILSNNANAGLDMEQPGDYLKIGGGMYSNGGLKSAVNNGSVSVTAVHQNYMAT
ncbi:glycoside hydrolase superfamily [Desarmillaria tabescens]|uniref:beta-glucosidase n=1 Tax=Armillaria tabescens TaxID=1929756 RepID=A0AA39JSC3_ARMTA|nr:glycoside hydrolase superfamily [Desarmillaria tabescens]KAK0445678.1 glycoside hydrolase superfamily [Desarmillaria tabescens]